MTTPFRERDNRKLLNLITTKEPFVHDATTKKFATVMKSVTAAFNTNRTDSVTTAQILENIELTYQKVAAVESGELKDVKLRPSDQPMYTEVHAQRNGEEEETAEEKDQIEGSQPSQKSATKGTKLLAARSFNLKLPDVGTERPGSESDNDAEPSKDNHTPKRVPVRNTRSTKSLSSKGTLRNGPQNTRRSTRLQSAATTSSNAKVKKRIAKAVSKNAAPPEALEPPPKKPKTAHTHALLLMALGKTKIKASNKKVIKVLEKMVKSGSAQLKEEKIRQKEAARYRTLLLEQNDLLLKRNQEQHHRFLELLNDPKE
ncbi:hypothetical protein BABINDRAFT_10561 [Babjeviella inositovora NRRL Y-12698]|uniref:Uncharacterized protein n=1 Tax=Babjeviella inositovora NRRL Y-12698 TaxID=984486 RepID=A0A1E3QH57_9ASCO|nr:uncharacterized protein BABINDRAFT_10561 [Babjeviella inositovora NRRL Y-12698]ODQ77029.1 hypothetical protein BABINDRAFT_10561 [Babjeviella inositovora NRRL Y-12698]